MRAVTCVAEVTRDEPEPSDVIAGGFRRAAKRDRAAAAGPDLPAPQASRLRFGSFELDAADAGAILALVSD